jgi:hypothetical protein
MSAAAVFIALFGGNLYIKSLILTLDCKNEENCSLLIGQFRSFFVLLYKLMAKLQYCTSNAAATLQRTIMSVSSSYGSKKHLLGQISSF